MVSLKIMPQSYFQMKRDLAKAETLELELRKQAEQSSRTSHEYTSLKDQMTALQTELNTSNTRKMTLENELLNARSELRDYKQRLVNSTILNEIDSNKAVHS